MNLDVFLSEAVDFLVQSGYAYTRPEAVALGRKLARDTRLFEHVTKVRSVSGFVIPFALRAVELILLDSRAAL